MISTNGEELWAFHLWAGGISTISPYRNEWQSRCNIISLQIEFLSPNLIVVNLHFISKDYYLTPK